MAPEKKALWAVQKTGDLLRCPKNCWAAPHLSIGSFWPKPTSHSSLWSDWLWNISGVLGHQMLNGEKCVKISLDVEAKLNSVGKRASSLAWISKILLRFSQASLHIIADHKPLLALSVNTVQPHHRYLPGSDDSTCFCPHVITACLFEKHTHMMTQMLWAGCLPPYHLSKRIPS